MTLSKATDHSLTTAKKETALVLAARRKVNKKFAQLVDLVRTLLDDVGRGELSWASLGSELAADVG